jgi:hypothetical protein
MHVIPIGHLAVTTLTHPLLLIVFGAMEPCQESSILNRELYRAVTDNMTQPRMR